MARIDPLVDPLQDPLGSPTQMKKDDQSTARSTPLVDPLRDPLGSPIQMKKDDQAQTGDGKEVVRKETESSEKTEEADTQTLEEEQLSTEEALDHLGISLPSGSPLKNEKNPFEAAADLLYMASKGEKRVAKRVKKAGEEFEKEKEKKEERYKYLKLFMSNRPTRHTLTA